MSDATATRRPGCQMILLIILVLFQIISALHVLQLPESIRTVVQFAPWLQAVLAFVWVLCFSVAIVAHLRRDQRATQWGNVLIIGFFGYSLLRLIIGASADYDRQRLPLLIAITLIILGPMAIALIREMLTSKR